jgi:uncharacterized membrane protein (DUF4010 family)
LGGALALMLNEWVLLAWVLGITALVAVAYYKIAAKDLGLTGELALISTALLGAVALRQPVLAAGLSVVIAALLYAKQALHRLSRELLSEHEVRDGLALLAAALVVLPLLPNRFIDPTQLINPYQLWKWVVLMMAISSVSHLLLRVTGHRYGFAVAGFFAGFVSSTAAIAGFGERAKNNQQLLRASVAAAMWAAMASAFMFFPLVAAVSTHMLEKTLSVFLPFAGVLLIGGVLGLRGGYTHELAPPTAKTHMFRFSQALIFAGILAAVLMMAKLFEHFFGTAGVWLGASLAGLVEVHAAVASVAQFAHEESYTARALQQGLLAILASSVIARSVVAFTMGGRAYGMRVSIGLLIAWCAALFVSMWWLA